MAKKMIAKKSMKYNICRLFITDPFWTANI